MSGTLTCKKGFFIIILSFLLLGLTSLASADDIHNDWHYSGDTFTVDGEVIMLTHYDFYDSTVILSVNKNTYIISKGGCKETATKKYCITDIFQDLAGSEEGDPIKFEGGKAYAGIKVLISTRGPDIEISRSFSTTTPELNQEVTVTITIDNDGIEGTDSFVYEESQFRRKLKALHRPRLAQHQFLEMRFVVVQHSLVPAHQATHRERHQQVIRTYGFQEHKV